MLQRLAAVTAVTGWFLSALAHQFPASMAVDAQHAPQLMNIRFQLVIFNPIWPEMFIFGGKRRPVFVIEVVFKTTMVIKADIITVVA